MPHKFICETADAHKKYTAVENIEFVLHEDASLDEMCDAFTSYLKAVGYHIKDGHILDIVPEDGYNEQGWDSFFAKEGTTEDFNPRDDEYDEAQEDWSNKHVSIDEASVQDWNNAYKSVTVTYNGVKYNEHD